MIRGVNIAVLLALAFLGAGAVAYYGTEPRVGAAKALMRIGQGVGAEEQLLEAIRRNPYDGEAWRELGTTFEGSKQLGSALTAYQKSSELQPERLELRIDIARVLFRLERDTEVGEILRTLLAEHPFYAPAIRLAGWQLVRQSARDALDVRGFHPDRNLLERADTHFLTALRIDPRDAEGLTGRALVAMWTGEHTRALELLDRATAIDSTGYWAWQMKGEIFDLLGRSTEAAEAFSRASLVAEGRPYSLEALAELSRGEKDYRRAAEYSARVGEAGAYAEGIALVKAGDLAGAERAFMRALAQNPEDEIALFQLEEVRIRLYPADDPLRSQLALRRLDKAREAQNVWNMLSAYRNFHRAIRLGPQNSAARLQFARFFEKIGFYSAAVQELRRVEELTRSQKERLDASDVLELIIRKGLEEMENVHGVDLAELWEEPTSVLARIMADPQTVEEKIRWGVSPVQSPRLRVAVFPFEEVVVPMHADVGTHAAQNLSTYLQLLPGVELVPLAAAEEAARRSGTRGGNLVDAGRLAGQIDADVILAGRILETDQETSIEYFMVGTSGPVLLREKISGRGSSALTQNVLEIARKVSASLPLEGTVIRRENLTFTVNLGRVHGIEVGDEFSIFRSGDDFVVPGLDWPGRRKKEIARGKVVRLTERYSELAPASGGDLFRTGDKAERALTTRESVQDLAARVDQSSRLSAR